MRVQYHLTHTFESLVQVYWGRDVRTGLEVNWE